MLGPFSNYRQTELNWLKRLPDSWGILRTKQVFRLRNEKAPENNQMELLSIYTHIGVKPRKELEQRGNKASSTDGYWIVKKSDIVLNKLLAWMGAVGVSHYEGVTSPAYDILRPIQRCNTDYFHYLFRTPKYLQQFKIRSRGIMDMRLRLYFDQLGQIPVPVPSTDEQDSIVLFLNWKTSQINKFIRNKRRLIELLKEQKQNIINQAVTRGLDPDVKLKPSGVEWIGDIPEHWEARRLKTVAKVVLGKMLKTSPSTDDLLKAYLRSANIQWFEADVSDVATMWFSPAEMKQYRILKNDILVSEGGEAGRACIWKDQLDECYIQNSVHKVTADEEILPLFLLYQFSALGSQGVFKAVVNRVSIAHLTREKLVVLFFCKPPVEEQKIIVEYIQGKSAEIDKSIFRAQREIELMREYRTRLISDVVTGQVDVRGIEVPEVAEEELLALEDDAAESDEVVDDEGEMDESD